MSSTNRGGQRAVSDYYKTPVYAIMDFLGNASKDEPSLFDFTNKLILDPCAGGATKKNESMSYPEALKKMPTTLTTVIDTIDIREDSPAGITTDYLTWKTEPVYDIIITNPPFALALPIIQKALSDVHDGGLVIMLLRLNFFGSKERFQFWQTTMPIYTYVHAKRMKFTQAGSDSIEYIHAVWQKGNYPKFTKLRII